ncbi:MAG: capsular biosynthesis protein [Pseudomonadota bacterium]
MAERKTFLFLQGHHTFFWVRLGDALRAAGHRVLKVRVSGQDVFYWPRWRDATSYRGSKARWKGWIEDYMRREGVTDVLYYADRQPWNVDALAAAKDAGVRAWTMEFGYLRPDWLTLEPEAMGRFSRFPKDPDAIRALDPGGDWDPMGGENVYPSAFWEDAQADIGMYFSTVSFWAFYPHYRMDIVFDMFTGYYHWIKTLLKEKRETAHALAVQEERLSSGEPYNLLAMQVPHDYQIRCSSDYEEYGDMMREVLASMARAAPADRRLVMKMHPLDQGYKGYRELIPKWVREFGLEGRVDLIRGGELGQLLDGSEGAIMANSTVGLHAIRQGVPVKAMADAIYDVPGLTHQGDLDGFWEAPAPVDRDLARSFLRAVASEIQVKGSFFNRKGQEHAIGEVVERLTKRPYPAWAT